MKKESDWMGKSKKVYNESVAEIIKDVSNYIRDIQTGENRKQFTDLPAELQDALVNGTHEQMSRAIQIITNGKAAGTVVLDDAARDLISKLRKEAQKSR